MKYAITTLILSSSIAFAGGSGGGGVLIAGMSANISEGVDVNSKEIIYFQGEYEGNVKFSYGTKVDGKWKIKKFELPLGEINDDSAMDALARSKDFNVWAEIR